MTVYIAHAPQDLGTAQALETFLERRGLFTELEDGEQPFKPLQIRDVVIALVSKDSVFSSWKLRFERRTLEAWAEQKLLLVKLDHHFAPVGLRDLPFLDASFEAQREFVWQQVTQRIAQMQQPPAPPPAAASDRGQNAAPQPAGPGTGAEPARRPAPARKMTRKRGGGAASGIGVVALLALLTAALFAAAPFLTAGRNEAWAAVLVMAAPFAPYVAAAGLACLAAALLLGILGRGGAKAAPAPEAPADEEGGEVVNDAVLGGFPEQELESARDADAPDPVFVSYARANAAVVLPVIEGVRSKGLPIWLDQEALQGGDSWAGEIVRAIRTAQSVMVMCSPAAFESDHVKREVYLADRYKKRLLPVFVENVAPPEDFEYFFAGVQRIDLFATPESERASLLSRALGAQ